MKHTQNDSPSAVRPMFLAIGCVLALLLLLAASLWPLPTERPRPVPTLATEQGAEATTELAAEPVDEGRTEAAQNSAPDSPRAPYEASVGTRLRFSLRAACRNVVRASGHEQPLESELSR